MKRIIFFLFIIGYSQLYSQVNIFDATRQGDLNEVISVYSKDPDVINKRNNEGYSPLILACYHGNEEVVKFLVDKVKDINQTSQYGSALMAAVIKGNNKIIEHLLDRNANTNIIDKNGTTAMHYAVMFRNYDALKLLMQANADIKIKDNSGKSPLDYASVYNDKKLKKILKHI